MVKAMTSNIITIVSIRVLGGNIHNKTNKTNTTNTQTKEKQKGKKKRLRLCRPQHTKQRFQAVPKILNSNCVLDLLVFTRKNVVVVVIVVERKEKRLEASAIQFMKVVVVVCLLACYELRFSSQCNSRCFFKSEIFPNRAGISKQSNVPKLV